MLVKLTPGMVYDWSILTTHNEFFIVIESIMRFPQGHWNDS